LTLRQQSKRIVPFLLSSAIDPFLPPGPVFSIAEHPWLKSCATPSEKDNSPLERDLPQFGRAARRY
jgi:hypothetical protein